MPPKGSQKAKKEAAAAAAAPAPAPAQATTRKPKPKPKAARTPTAPTPAKPPTTKTPAVSQTLEEDATTDHIPIEVVHRGESTQATLVKGNYAHTIDLKAPRPFSLVKTIIIPSGEHEGLQAILIKPSKAFPFLKLPKEAQTRVYKLYFAPGGIINGDITLESKRKENKDVYAKSYSGEFRHRIALLTVNKEIYNEAIKVFYANTIMLESTTTLLDFLSQIDRPTYPRLKSIRIQAFIKTTSRNAMHFLAQAGNVTRLHIDSGVFSECDPLKAAKAFYGDAGKFLEGVAATQGSKEAAVDILSFGKNALIWRDEQKKAKPWGEEQVAEFREALKGRMQ